MVSPVPNSPAPLRNPILHRCDPTLTKVVPASQLKQLRGIACLLCYDHMFTEPTMKTDDMRRMAYNLYHGNEEKNIISQIHLLVNGTGRYAHMYNTETTIVTDRDTDSNEVNTPNTCKLVLKPLFSNSALLTSTTNFISKFHYDETVLSCPHKKVTDEKCSGRYIIDNARICIKHIKKAIVIADECLDDGGLPSGRSWDDLYSHILSEYKQINEKEPIFQGFIAFVCFTKYNEEGTNHLSVLCVNDEDDCKFSKGGRTVSRKRQKIDKNEVRDIETGSSPFSSRGLSIATRMEIIELAQYEDSKVREDLQSQLTQLNVKSDLLLRERSQQIELAKIICPVYDKSDSNWMQVITLTENMQEVKQIFLFVEEERVEALKKDKSTQLANRFVDSICAKDSPTKTIVDISVKDTPNKTIVGIIDKEDSLTYEKMDDDNDKDSIELDNVAYTSRILDMEKDADDMIRNDTTRSVSQS